MLSGKIGKIIMENGRLGKYTIFALKEAIHGQDINIMMRPTQCKPWLNRRLADKQEDWATRLSLVSRRPRSPLRRIAHYRSPGVHCRVALCAGQALINSIALISA